MDINVLRILVTLVAIAAYVAIFCWAFAPARKDQLDAEARRILEEAEL